MAVEFDGRCFGCGPLNPEGLQLEFAPSGEEVVAEFAVPDRFQSWNGVVHGGVVALILDEAVGWAAWNAGHPGVTGKLQVRYRKPLMVGDQIRIYGRVTRLRRSLVEAQARIESSSEQTIAEASATLMGVPVSMDDAAAAIAARRAPHPA